MVCDKQSRWSLFILCGLLDDLEVQYDLEFQIECQLHQLFNSWYTFANDVDESPQYSASHKALKERERFFLPHSQGTAGDILEEGRDDVKSSWPLWAGPHTCCNGNDNVKQGCKAKRIQKDCLSSDCSLQLGNMKLESLVIADQHAAVPDVEKVPILNVNLRTVSDVIKVSVLNANLRTVSDVAKISVIAKVSDVAKDRFMKVQLQLPPKSMRFVAAKVALDGIIFGPLDLCVFFIYMGLTSGKSIPQVKEDLKRDFLLALVLEGGVWPIVQIANFRFILVRSKDKADATEGHNHLLLSFSPDPAVYLSSFSLRLKYTLDVKGIQQSKSLVHMMQAAMIRTEDGVHRGDLLYDHFSEKEELWIDFMADTGDGGNSSYVVARLLT
ncbi:hypothetical protein GIB67_004985 [Kingdonia uniflora]|uniref:Uncharacterized protein n=1 Tax=Kingdonia uniflora TaxID=39325 RepID=A0A7J7NMW3_9MAGN|nr:hypothetical protein GIB67_004985 [Kingdonia uniflora]